MNNDRQAVAKILRLLAHEFGNRLLPATMLIDALVCDTEGESAEDLRVSLASLNAMVELTSVLRAFSRFLDEDVLDDRTLHAKFLEVLATRVPGSEAMALLKRGLSVAHPSTEAGDGT